MNGVFSKGVMIDDYEGIALLVLNYPYPRHPFKKLTWTCNNHIHEFVHFTGEKKLLAAHSGGGAKQEKGKPINLSSTFVQFVWLNSDVVGAPQPINY